MYIGTDYSRTGKPKKLLVLRDGRRAFLICENETKVVVIVQARGSIDKSYKVVFDHSLHGDLIADMCTSEREQLLLIRASRNLLLYDMEHESIRQHWPRPPEIPNEFKLPNSSDYVQLTFSEAHFALRDRLVLAAIFRDVLIWSVHNGQPVTMIHAPVGLLNGILVVAPPPKPDEVSTFNTEAHFVVRVHVLVSMYLRLSYFRSFLIAKL